MTVVELIKEKTEKKHFSFEVLPPLKGSGTEKLFATIEKLKDLDPLLMLAVLATTITVNTCITSWIAGCCSVVASAAVQALLPLLLLFRTSSIYRCSHTLYAVVPL